MERRPDLSTSRGSVHVVEEKPPPPWEVDPFSTSNTRHALPSPTEEEVQRAKEALALRGYLHPTYADIQQVLQYVHSMAHPSSSPLPSSSPPHAARSHATPDVKPMTRTQRAHRASKTTSQKRILGEEDEKEEEEEEIPSMPVATSRRRWKTAAIHGGRAAHPPPHYLPSSARCTAGGGPAGKIPRTRPPPPPLPSRPPWNPHLSTAEERRGPLIQGPHFPPSSSRAAEAAAAPVYPFFVGKHGHAGILARRPNVKSMRRTGGGGCSPYVPWGFLWRPNGVMSRYAGTMRMPDPMAMAAAAAAMAPLSQQPQLPLPQKKRKKTTGGAREEEGERSGGSGGASTRKTPRGMERKWSSPHRSKDPEVERSSTRWNSAATSPLYSEEEVVVEEDDEENEQESRTRMEMGPFSPSARMAQYMKEYEKEMGALYAQHPLLAPEGDPRDLFPRARRHGSGGDHRSRGDGGGGRRRRVGGGEPQRSRAAPVASTTHLSPASSSHLHSSSSPPWWWWSSPISIRGEPGYPLASSSSSPPPPHPEEEEILPKSNTTKKTKKGGAKERQVLPMPRRRNPAVLARASPRTGGNVVFDPHGEARYRYRPPSSSSSPWKTSSTREKHRGDGSEKEEGTRFQRTLPVSSTSRKTHGKQSSTRSTGQAVMASRSPSHEGSDDMDEEEEVEVEEDEEMVQEEKREVMERKRHDHSGGDGRGIGKKGKTKAYRLPRGMRSAASGSAEPQRTTAEAGTPLYPSYSHTPFASPLLPFSPLLLSSLFSGTPETEVVPAKGKRVFLDPTGSTLQRKADPVQRGQQMRALWRKDVFLARAKAKGLIDL